LTHCLAHTHTPHLSAQVGARNSGGNVWGVSLVPTGCTEESHPELAEIIRSQNKR
jgi:hypothetical protein